MHLTIQIPCYNEAQTLPLVLAQIPKQFEGIDVVEIVVIDDGSTDDTGKIALANGATKVIRIPGKNRRWLGRAFRAGLEEAFKTGTDILVNTDGDNQYPANRIVDLVESVKSNRADIAIGNRYATPASLSNLNSTKALLSRIGNWLIGVLTKEETPDALSGFRAYSRRALFEIYVTANDSYTVDTLMQAYQKGLDVEWIPIIPNSPTRPSRLFKSNRDAVFRSLPNILRACFVYQPVRIFLPLAALFFALGIAIALRFVFFYLFSEDSSGHVQSLIASAILIFAGFQFVALAVIGDAMAALRKLTEATLVKLQRSNYGDIGR
jgi:glycosyltransferase involved in cell wall biosynthesis